jgi:Zn-dependent peptidase ImmA (M78 family)
MNKEKILLEAINIFKKNGLIDIVEFAKNLNIDVFGDDLCSESSYIVLNKQNGRYQIFVNTNDTKQRQRFSIAHEIGHFILHKDLIDKYGKVSRDNLNSLDIEKEKEADKIASDILMPENIVKDFVEGLLKSNINNNTIYNVMEYFNVSKPFAILRLRNLNYYVPWID